MKLLKGWALLVGLLALAQPLHAHERSLSTTTVDSLKLQQPFKGHFYCPETKVHLYLDLYEESIEVPGFSFLGKMQGYMEGGIYGTWMLIKHEIRAGQRKVLLRFSNDIGSDSQNIEFTQINDSTFTYQAVEGNAIKKAVGRKLVKVTDQMKFIRQ